VIKVKWAGKEHPILIVTAGTDVHNRESFVGGYEHIWDEGIKENQSLYLSWVCLCHPAYDHACIAVAYKDHLFREPRQLERNVLYVLP